MTAAMTAKFLTPLQLEEVTDPNGIPLKNRSGKQLYRVLRLFQFYSAKFGVLISVKAGFITDLDSTPRIPIVYLVVNGFGDGPAVVHDYLYSTGAMPRADCDAVLVEACKVVGVPAWKRALIWAGVRVGGSGHFAESYEA